VKEIWAGLGELFLEEHVPQHIACVKKTRMGRMVEEALAKREVAGEQPVVCYNGT
jgi:hypothetical protein